MGHQISAVILQGDYDAPVAARYDLQGPALGFGLTMFYIDHYYTACWAKMLGRPGVLEAPVSGYPGVFPRDAVVATLMSTVSGKADPCFAIVQTDYFGGNGGQWAAVYRGDRLVERQLTSINDALRYLGVTRHEIEEPTIARPGLRKVMRSLGLLHVTTHDEFDTVGLGRYRSMPGYLQKYMDLADELGV